MTIGQAVGGAVGAVGGFFLGNPLLGFQIGMGIGSFIDPPSAEEANFSLQTQDLQFNVFTRNLPVPIVYGTCRVAGNILWIGNTFTEIVEREADGSVRRVRIVPPPPGATPGLMHELVEGYARAVDAGREPLILVPLANGPKMVPLPVSST